MMPCGPLDQRRKVHRCLHCRTHHSKCDSGRPCGPCKIRNLKCDESLSSLAAQDITMVAYRPRPSNHTISRTLGINSWLYIQIFFDAIGNSDSPLSFAFSFDEIGHGVAENGLVFDALTAVGFTYAVQTHAIPEISSIERAEMCALCSAFRQTIASKISDPDALQDPLFLLSVQLYSFGELMTDKTGQKWEDIIRHLERVSFPRLVYDSNLVGKHNAFIFKFTRMSFAFRNLMSYHHRDPFLPAIAESPYRTSSAFGPRQELHVFPYDKIDLLTEVLERWCLLKNQSMIWMQSLKELHHPDSVLSQDSSLYLDGLQIICSACELQKEVISLILASAERSKLGPDPAQESMLPFYLWCLTGISQLFSKPAWTSRGWILPIMQEALLSEQALKAFEYAEESIRKVRLEAILYAPIISEVGEEMSSAKDRERVLKGLRDIENKGFAVASSFEDDLRAYWSKPQTWP